MSAREQWIEFLRAPDHGGRYLYLRGDSRYRPEPDELSPDVAEFFKLLTSKSEDLSLLLALHFLSTKPVVSFILEHCRELIRGASHTSSRVFSVSQGGVRGKIDWKQTIQARNQRSRGSSFFVVVNPEKTSDTPENRLLKVFLSRIVALVDHASLLVGSGALAEHLRTLHRAALIHLKEPYLRDLPTTNPTSIMRRRARRHRNWRYHVLADLQEYLEQVFEQGHWPTVTELLRLGWFLPIDDDDLFELYVLVATLDVLQGDIGLGKPFKIGVIRQGRDSIATFALSDGASLSVYFDQSPSHFLPPSSEYVDTCRAYGIRANERRPDIALIINNSKLSGCLFIEVKKSSDDQYERDSVYKALAYLRDFAGIWTSVPEQYPRVAVLFPSLRAPDSPSFENNKQLVLIGADDRARLRACVERFLTSSAVSGAQGSILA